MRLRFASSALAVGLILGWAAVAQADPAPAASAAPPPAAPIFYCPTPAAAASPAPSNAGAPALHRTQSHALCPRPQRIAHARRHVRRHEEARYDVARAEISQSQAYIYGYERALHGLNERAAEEAWGPRPTRPMGPPMMMMAPPPGPPLVAAAPPPAIDARPLPPLRPDDHWRERHELAQAGPPHPPVAVPAPTPPRLAEPDRWRDADREQAVREQAMREQAERDRAEQARVDHEEAERVLAMRQQADRDRAAREEAARDEAMRAEAMRERDRWNSWRARDREQAWERRDDRWGEPGALAYNDGRYASGRYGYERRFALRQQRVPPCPPPRDIGCSAGAADPPPADGQWRDGGYGPVYRVAGRDAYGYLVWPGKTP